MRKNDSTSELPRAPKRRRAAVNAGTNDTGWVMRPVGAVTGAVVKAPNYHGGEGWDLLRGGPIEGVRCIGVGSADTFLHEVVMTPLSAIDALGVDLTRMGPVFINCVDAEPSPPMSGMSAHAAVLRAVTATNETVERMTKRVIQPRAYVTAKGAHPSLEAAKTALLAEASAAVAAGDSETHLRSAALALLGLDTAAIHTEEDLIAAIATGFSARALEALRTAGWPYAVMETVIAPRRTLMRRKREGQLLSPSESDAAWRLALVLVSAETVFASREASLAWLLRAKVGLRDRTPAELIASSVGTAHILSLLRRIDQGDYL